MRSRFGVVVTVCLALSVSLAQALTVGDPAPKLAVGPFIKGQPVAEFKAGTIYVVEFWATWCGPCRATIPHLTELAHKYRDVVFIGANVWEPDPTKAKPFVDQMGDQMDYRVALDNDGQMAATWMEAAGQDGIPASFVVNGEGKLAWVGHPAMLEEPLAAVVAGRWDLASPRAEAVKDAARKAKLREVQGKMRAANGDLKQQIEIYRAWFADDPGAQREYGVGLFSLMRRIDPDGAAAYYRELTTMVLWDDAEALNGAAWQVVDPRARCRDLVLVRLALNAAIRADELTKSRNASILDTLAAAWWQAGDGDRAANLQSHALAMVLGTPMEKELRMHLALYEAAAGRPAVSGCPRTARGATLK